MDYLLLYCVLLFIACAIRESSSFLNNSTYTFDKYCADTNHKNYTSWMWNKTTCESQWLNKTDSDIGEMSLELLKHMKNDYVQTRHSIINKERMNKIFNDLSNGLDVRVIVFGGSFTAGRQGGGINHAWPNRLENMWNESSNVAHTTKGKLSISNYAVGATTSTWLLYRLSSLLHNTTSVDLVIIDYDVNDCVQYSDVDKNKTEELNSITEVIIRRILEMESKPAIIYLNVAINHRNGDQLSPNCIEDLACYTMDYSRYNILKAYSIPFISQKFALWSNFSCPAPKKYWDCSRSCAHPGYGAHTTVAKILHYYFSQNLNTTKNNFDKHELHTLPYLSEYSEDLDKDVCRNDVFTVDHLNSPEIQYNYTHHLPTHVKNITIGRNNYMKCWDYKEDVIGKPGWIIDHEDCLNSSIIFNVQFGDLKSFSVTILTTYNNSAGGAEVYLSQSIINPDEISTEDVDYTKLTYLSSYYAHPDNAKGFSYSTVYTFRSASWKVKNDHKHHLVQFKIIDDHMISSNSTHLHYTSILNQSIYMICSLTHICLLIP